MYRASPADGVVWITGASSGIGRQVALDLAKKGYTVIATARRAADLDALAGEAHGSGRIIAAPCDVVDSEATAALVAHIIATHGPIALAFLNVGINVVDPKNAMDAKSAWITMEANVRTVANGLDPIIAHMHTIGRGQIAITASLAGFSGMPGWGYYGASKAALINLAETLHAELKPQGITVQVVTPGFIRTPLTDGSSTPMPFIMPVEEASARILSGFATRGFEITFPRRLSWFLKLIRILPYWLYFPIVDAVLGPRSSKPKG